MNTRVYAFSFPNTFNQYNQVIVADIHQEWCGLCDAILPTLNRVFMDYDQAEARITLADVSLGKVDADDVTATFPSDSKVNLSGCMPVFAIYRFGACVSVVQGVDAPALLSAIAINIPDKPSDHQ